MVFQGAKDLYFHKTNWLMEKYGSLVGYLIEVA